MTADHADRAYAFLVDRHGMHPDRDLLKLFDLREFDDGPHAFAVACKKKAPGAFKGRDFDARTASEAEVTKRLQDSARDSRARRDAAKTDAIRAIGDVRSMSAEEWSAVQKRIR